MDANESLSTLTGTLEKFKNYSVFEVNFNGNKIKMMCLKDVKQILKDSIDPKKCKICRETDGNQIADGLVICPKCEEAYF